MGGKPDDIPKGVWDGAENTLDTMLSNHGYEGWRDDSIATIARAVMAAAAAEREACALVADAEASGRYRQRDKAKLDKSRVIARDYESMGMAAIHIAFAIRKRGEA